jgi:hypothetical protein
VGGYIIPLFRCTDTISGFRTALKPGDGELLYQLLVLIIGSGLYYVLTSDSYYIIIISIEYFVVCYSSAGHGY